jgi:signal transduction histidine kinase
LLTVVIGNLEIIQRHLDSVSGGVTTRLKRAANSALRGAHRAAALTQRLLAFARHHTLDPKPLDLKRFIAREVEFLQRSLGETIMVEAVGSSPSGQIEVDANELEAALLNLAINARDAMPKGGTLRIETSDVVLDEDYCRANPEVRRGEYVLIAVTDNGIGMSPTCASAHSSRFIRPRRRVRGQVWGSARCMGSSSSAKDTSRSIASWAKARR